MNTRSKNNPLRHTRKVKVQLRQVINQLREDVEKVPEAKAQALFETSDEMHTGLVKAFEDTRRKPKRRGGLSH